MDPLAQWCCERLQGMQADRINFDTIYERIARVVLPTSAGFRTTYAPGANRSQDIFDSTAQLALPRFAAAIDTLITPQTMRWHSLVPGDKQLASNQQVRVALNRINDILFAVRYSPKGNFASRVFETYMSLGAFGNGVLYIHDAMPGIRYQSLHLAEFLFDEDASGIIDTGFWIHEYKLRQLVQKWGEEQLPAALRGDVQKSPNRLVKVCMAVFPREERTPTRKDAKNAPFACVHFLPEHGVILSQSGYYSFPFAVARYVTASREIMGHGPAQDVLADNLTLQEMEKTVLRFGQLVVDPPLLLSDSDSLDPFNVRPGAMNFGYLTPDGKEMIAPMAPKGDPKLSFDMQEQKRESINTAFLINLFQVLIDQGSDRKTATEIMQLVQEKGALLGPIGGRLRSEFLGSIIHRELDILFRAGVIGTQDLPPELQQDGRFDIQYDSPLTRAMKAEEGVGILRTIDLAIQLGQIDPSAVKMLNVPVVMTRMAELNGAPPDILLDAQEIAARQQEEQQQVMAQQVAAAAPGVSQAVKNFAQAAQISQGQSVPGNTTGVV